MNLHDEESFLVGMNKGDHHSSVALLKALSPRPQLQIFLNERLRGVKYAGGWPLEALESLPRHLDYFQIPMAENSFGLDTKNTEIKWEENYLFFELMRRKSLTAFSPHHNPKIRFFTHHLCHAMSAVALSPFERAIIVVQDGVGNLRDAFPPHHDELKINPPAISPLQGHWAESCSIYLQTGPKLECVEKEWQLMRPFYGVRDEQGYDPEDFSEGMGTFYGACAKFVFNSFHDAGKLMGLAPYGVSERVASRWAYLQGLDWEREAFKGKGKKSWEASGRFQGYANCASTVQEHFVEAQMALLRSLKRRFPHFDQLILTGGCALNCVFNMKAFSSKIFRDIYVPPFPGDEGISLGAAGLLYYGLHPESWTPLPMDGQTSFFGPCSSMTDDREIFEAFKTFDTTKPEDVAVEGGRLLQEGKIVAWFQGRSESGPRALGHRSILASPLRKGIKEYLNEKVKGRESFRPYGCSCLWEKASTYFEVPGEFDSPFMSFAPQVKSPYKEALQEVTSVDGVSRIQTVRISSDPLFHRLIFEFGARTGLYCLLNTSLNIMGRPIVETIQDALLFFETTPVDAMVVGPFLIQR